LGDDLIKSFYNSVLPMQKGQTVLIFTILALAVSLLVIAGFSVVAIREEAVRRTGEDSKKSYFLAEAGVEDVAYRMFKGVPYDAVETLTIDDSSAVTAVTDTGFDQKSIQGEGSVRNAVRTVNASIRTSVGAVFNYGAQVGYLGLFMDPTAVINGNVFSNGVVKRIGNTGQPSINGDASAAQLPSGDPNHPKNLTGLSATNTPAYDYLLRDTSNRADAAQKFLAPVTAVPSQVKFFIKKVGNPANLSVRVVADDGTGKPSRQNADVVVTGTLLTNSVGTSYGWVSVTLSTNSVEDTLYQGGYYWIVLDNGSGGTSESKYYVLGGGDPSTYPDGEFLYSPDWNNTNATWSIQPGSSPPNPGAGDIAFDLFLGTQNTSLEYMRIGQPGSGAGSAWAHTVIGSTIEKNASSTILTNSEVRGIANCDMAQSSGNTIIGPPSTCLSPSFNGPLPFPEPISDSTINSLIADAQSGGTIAGNVSVAGNDVTNLGPTVITGDLRVEGNATLNVGGSIYVQGNARFRNNVVVKLDPSYGQKSGAIIVDGTVEAEGNSKYYGSGASNPNSYLVVISRNPSIATPDAIHMTYGAYADAKVVFYAAEGGIRIEKQGQDSPSLSSVFGQRVQIEDDTVVNYETGVADIRFFVGPSGGWSFDGWGEVE
jgi:hypothetical protein